MEEKIKTTLYRRGVYILEKIEPLLERLKVDEVFIAGSSIAQPKFRDIDIFLTFLLQTNHMEYNPWFVEVTRQGNLDFLVNGFKVQVINSRTFVTLDEVLVDFDFTHIQAGVRVKWIENVGYRVCDPTYTNGWLHARATGISRYLQGQKFPFSSLARMYKYIVDGSINKAAYNLILVDILEDMGTILPDTFLISEGYWELLEENAINT